MSKNCSNAIVMRGRSATSFISRSNNPNASISAKANNYFAHVSSTTTVSKKGETITIRSTGAKFSPK